MNSITARTLNLLEDAIDEALVDLLTNRFVYQAVHVKTEALIQDLNVRPPPKPSMTFDGPSVPITPEAPDTSQTLEALSRMRWMLIPPENWERRSQADRTAPLVKLPRFIRACIQCKTPTSPYTPGGPNTQAAIKESMGFTPAGKPTQTWILTYTCQSCDYEPLFLMIRREDFKLSITGRNLFEEVAVPKYIPKEINSHYRESIIARNVGKELAAALYLRVAIEQHMRRVTGITERTRGEELCDLYTKLLHPEFPSSMRSLRTPYDKLSEPIHRGEPDISGYETSLDQINRHFQQLKILPIVKESPQPTEGARISDPV